MGLVTLTETNLETSDIFRLMGKGHHEQVCFFFEPTFGLKGIVAIHDTTLGPALGGCRMWSYESERDALIDVLRLSRGMTYKAALAGLNLGGGKAVIIGDSEKDKSEVLWRAFGRFVEGLGGRYITAEDVGTSVEDMVIVRKESQFVSGLPRQDGGSGDPSPVTARGVFAGIKAAVKTRLGLDHLNGIKVAVQGVGHVGLHLVRQLRDEGAEVLVSDIDEKRVGRAVSEFGAVPVPIAEIHRLDVDVFAPCALGAVINDESLPEMRCSIVAGGANNVLKNSDRHGRMLFERGILYAPDYVINAGGLYNVYNELQGNDIEVALRQAEGIYDTLLEIFQLSEKEHVPPNEASDRVARARVELARKQKKNQLDTIYLPRDSGNK